MTDHDVLDRRTFLGTAAGAAAVTLVPRHVLGGPRYVPPSDRINVAYVGCGTQGLRQLMPALESPDLRVVAVCDPNRRSEDYVEWGRFELRDKIRAFLKDPAWAEGARSCPCGREVGRELVDRHYGATSGGGCRAYADFRELLAQEKDLDAVYIHDARPPARHGRVSRPCGPGKHVDHAQADRERAARGAARRRAPRERRARPRTSSARPGRRTPRRSPSGSPPGPSVPCARSTTGRRGRSGRRA